MSYFCACVSFLRESSALSLQVITLDGVFRKLRTGFAFFTPVSESQFIEDTCLTHLAVILSVETLAKGSVFLASTKMILEAVIYSFPHLSEMTE